MSNKGINKANKGIIKKLQTNKGHLIFALSVVVLAIIINGVVSLTTGVNVLSNTVNFVTNKKSPNNQEVKSIGLTSDDYNNNVGGSYDINKSAEWTGTDTAQIDFDVDTKEKIGVKPRDIIFVLDTSGSMSGSRISSVKKDAIEFITKFSENKENQMALISFDSKAITLSNFTNEFDGLISKINDINDEISEYALTNYYQALIEVNKLLETYEKKEGRDVMVFFLTDGLPCMGRPNEVNQYKLLKEKYPYLIINGVQYEMGYYIRDEIKNISDNQYAANSYNLSSIMNDVMYDIENYEKFELIDYIDDDYFYVESVDDIKVSMGKVILTEENGVQKVIWTAEPNEFKTGKSANMTINLKLKKQYVGSEGYYPTNKKFEVTTKLYNEKEKKATTKETPILKSGYKVYYDTNTPTGCNIDNFEETHYTFENVKIADKLSCDGYTFKGWKIIDKVKRVNDDYFIMATSDVHFVATWTKHDIKKSMEGEVREAKFLYKTIEEEANKSGGQATKYTNQVDDTFETGANMNVYYFTGNTNNNVIFADNCWKIVRTTTTGGVKLLYNGKPSNNQCTATGAAATIGDSEFNTNFNSPAYVGYMYGKIYTHKQGLSSGLFGEDVKYEDGEYRLIGTSTTMDANHHYSCNNSNGTCSTVRYYYNENYYYIELDGKAKNIDEALDQMLAENTNDSTIKEKIDKWYEDNILGTEHDDKLEDTIFCNDRSITNKQSNGWNPKGGSLSAYLYFKENKISSDLTCTNITDRFSTKNDKAKLDYPIGLLSIPEANLMVKDARNIGAYYWLGSPNSFFNNLAIARVVSSGGIFNVASGVSSSYGVRPVVSLVPGTVYSEGDGTTTSPFVID